MKTYDDFEKWFEENRRDELMSDLMDKVAAAQQLSILEGESDLDSQFEGLTHMVLAYTDLKLRAYHEWLCENLT